MFTGRHLEHQENSLPSSAGKRSLDGSRGSLTQGDRMEVFGLFSLGSSCFNVLLGECRRFFKAQASHSLTYTFSCLHPFLLKDVNANQCLIVRVGPYSDFQRAKLVMVRQ